jgi:UDP-2-acetamido-2,6-beta-L-arabino-hexul-4-ose reductase
VANTPWLRSDFLKVLITGANGFVGKNLRLDLAEHKDVEAVCFTREHSLDELPELLDGVGFVFHLAGVNRPQDPAEFVAGNTDLTKALCQALAGVADATSRKVPVVFSSSTQAAHDNPYGASKRAAEDALFALQRTHGVPVHVFRLPNVFGKWCKPDYNSAVATFCHNVARDLPIKVNDPAALLTLVYVDDVLQRFIQLMDGADATFDANGFAMLAPQYTTTVGEVAWLIQSFKESRQTLMTERVGTGMGRALYATYVSYLPPEAFSYTVPMCSDPRGVFTEMLKTPDCGQFSYFTAHPGVTRGGHYHHSKTEKFLVIKGQARFKFRHMHTGETYEMTTSGEKAEIVETVPGWTHDITNIGSEEMIVMLWANEVFDRQRPDTFACPL